MCNLARVLNPSGLIKWSFLSWTYWSLSSDNLIFILPIYSPFKSLALSDTINFISSTPDLIGLSNIKLKLYKSKLSLNIGLIELLTILVS